MPTNLPPEYYEVEKRYKDAATPAEKAEALEELLSTIPKHKGTDHLRADLRRKLAKLKESAETATKRGGGRASAYHIDQEGAGTVALVGLANTGKSSLLRVMTNAEPEVSPAPFTTWEPTPGMVVVELVPVQLIDTPPLQPEFVEPELINLLRRVDLLVVVVNLQTDPVQQLHESMRILAEHRILPQRLLENGEALPRHTYLPVLVAVNQCDHAEDAELYTIFCELLEETWPCHPVSAVSEYGLLALQQAILAELDVVRVYARVPGKGVDLSAPFVLSGAARWPILPARCIKIFTSRWRPPGCGAARSSRGRWCRANMCWQTGILSS